MQPLDQSQFTQLSNMIQQGFEKLSQDFNLLSSRILRLEYQMQQLNTSMND